MSARLLVLEDDEALAAILEYNLRKAGYRVELAADGDEAMLRLQENPPDLAILDWMTPGLSGLEICRRLRARPETRLLPVIMLTARGEEADRVRGLDAGADDYLSKPFSIVELQARARALLRRAQAGGEGDSLSFGDVTLDLKAHRARRAGREIHLGPTEYRLLEALMRRPGRVLSRERLLDLAWGEGSEVEIRTVDVHIGRLRKALGEPDVLRTVRAAGYALEASAP